MRSHEIEALKKHLKLSHLQREVIVGLLLGDAHLETSNHGKTYRLRIEYSAKQQQYINWVWNIFREWVRTPPQKKKKISRKGTAIETIWFNTYAHGALRFYAHQFYSREGKRVIPKMVQKLLTPLSVAIWFMDDGSWKSNQHRTYIIHSDGYIKSDLQRIQKALRIRFGVETSLHRQYSNWRIYIKTSSANVFRKLIEPYILPSMKYKLGNIMHKE